MTAKEYLSQAYRLDQRINSDILEIQSLRQLAACASTSCFGEKVTASRSTNPPYLHKLQRIIDLENKIDAEINLLVELKEQIRETIDRVTNIDEQMVLRYRYIHNMTWERIGEEMNADSRTIRRWHTSALSKVSIPK